MLLGLVLDIKNNRRRAGKAAAAAPPALAPAVARFLKDAGVDAVRLRGLPWAKLLAPDKRVRARRRGIPWLARAAQGQQAGSRAAQAGVRVSGTAPGHMGTNSVMGLGTCRIAGMHPIVSSPADRRDRCDKDRGASEPPIATALLRAAASHRAQGMWWLPGAGDAGALPALAGAGAALAGRGGPGAGANGEGGGAGSGGAGGGELLRLAAAQRMSTEARRAVFCVVLDSTDCADALERLLRLPLKARPSPVAHGVRRVAVRSECWSCCRRALC